MKSRSAPECRQTFRVYRLLAVAILLQTISAHQIPFHQYPYQQYRPNSWSPFSPPSCDCAYPVTPSPKVKTPYPVFFPYTVPVPWPTPFNGTNFAPVPKANPAVIPVIPEPPNEDTYPMYIPLPQFEYIPLYYNVSSKADILQPIPPERNPLSQNVPQLNLPETSEPLPGEKPNIPENLSRPISPQLHPHELLSQIQKTFLQPGSFLFPMQPHSRPQPQTPVEPTITYSGTISSQPGLPQTTLEPTHIPFVTCPPKPCLTEQNSCPEPSLPPQPFAYHQSTGVLIPEPVDYPNHGYPQVIHPQAHSPLAKQIWAHPPEMLAELIRPYPSIHHTRGSTAHYAHNNRFDVAASGLDLVPFSEPSPVPCCPEISRNDNPQYHFPGHYVNKPYYYTPHVEQTTYITRSDPSFQDAATDDTITADVNLPSSPNQNPTIPNPLPSQQTLSSEKKPETEISIQDVLKGFVFFDPRTGVLIKEQPLQPTIPPFVHPQPSPRPPSPPPTQTQLCSPHQPQQPNLCTSAQPPSTRLSPLPHHPSTRPPTHSQAPSSHPPNRPSLPQHPPSRPPTSSKPPLPLPTKPIAPPQPPPLPPAPSPPTQPTAPPQPPPLTPAQSPPTQPAAPPQPPTLPQPPITPPSPAVTIGGRTSAVVPTAQPEQDNAGYVIYHPDSFTIVQENIEPEDTSTNGQDHSIIHKSSTVTIFHDDPHLSEKIIK